MLNIDSNFIIGLISILTILWSLFYAIPSLIKTLLHSFIGILITFLTSLLILKYNYNYGILFIIIAFILYQISNVKEGFSWTEKSINDFLLLQNTINRGRFFDIGKIQENASQEEVDYYLETEKWPWSDETKKLYMDASSKNSYVRNYKERDLDRARGIYNEFNILKILSWQEKEGQFLMNGVVVSDKDQSRNGLGSYPYKYNMIKLKDRKSADAVLYKCNTKSEMEEEKDGKTRIITNYSELEEKIPNFKFVKGPCNPCVALNAEPDYSCPFELEVYKEEYIGQDNEKGISKVWKKLWNL
jgi:hypothetical protein